jgi:hypothetical protein
MRSANKFLFLTVAVLLCVVIGVAQSGRSAGLTVYLLEDAQAQQWCAYTDQTAWKSSVDSLQALDVATVEYRNEHSSTVNFTQEDEAGDWIVYDRYSLDQNGQPKRLHRKINILPGDLNVEQVIQIQNGTTKKVSTVRRRLSTGKVLEKSSDVWLPQLPIIKNTKGFPFSSLLDKRAESSEDKDCRPAARQ